MFNNIKNFYICLYYSENECTKIKVQSSSEGYVIRNAAIDIRKNKDQENMKFTIRNSRINVYVEWNHPKTKENILTRLRILNGKNYTYR